MQNFTQLVVVALKFTDDEYNIKGQSENDISTYPDQIKRNIVRGWRSEAKLKCKLPLTSSKGFRDVISWNSLIALITVVVPTNPDQNFKDCWSWPWPKNRLNGKHRWRHQGQMHGNTEKHRLTWCKLGDVHSDGCIATTDQIWAHMTSSKGKNYFMS